MSPQSRAPIAVAVLLPSAMAAATILYTTLAVLATFVLDDLDMSRAELGLVVAVFSAASAMLSPFIGRLADRVGARAGMFIVFLLTGVGFLLMSRSTSFVTLLGAALVIGVGQSMANPATNKMIAEQYEPGRRGLITGIKQSGVQAGTFVGGLLFPRLAEAAGWRTVPVVIGGAVLAAFVVSWLRLPADENGGTGPVETAAGRVPAATWWVAAYAFLMGAGGSPIFSFLPLYATEVVGMSEAEAGVVIAVAGLIGVFARIRWSVYAERRGEFGQPMLVIAGIAFVAGAITIGAGTWGALALWVAAILGWMSISAWNSIAMLAVITHAGPGLSGKASGIVLFGFLWGLAVSPPVFGWSVDRLGTYTPGLVAVTSLFVAAVVTMAMYLRRGAGSPNASAARRR